MRNHSEGDTHPLSISDDFGLLLEGTNNPQNISFEVVMTGHLDVVRLQAAVASAVDAHTRMRARLVTREGGTLQWQIGKRQPVPVSLYACSAPSEMHEVRGRVLNDRMDIAHGSLRVMILRDASHDCVLFAVHHAVCDGMGTLRFVTSVLRRYAGAPDPIEHATPLQPLPDPGNALSARKRFAPLLEHLQPSLRQKRVAIASVGADLAHDNRFTFRTFDRDSLRRAREALCNSSRREETAPTINDVLLSALHVAIERWNQRFGVVSELIAIVSPVNVRPAQHATEPLGNYSSALATATTPSERASLAEAARSVTRQTSAFKDWKTAHAMFRWMNRAPRPTGVVRSLARVAVSRSSGTAILSNLGHLEHSDFPLDLGALKVCDVRFAPPMPEGVGLAVGVAFVDGSCSLTFRYRASQFGASAAEDFADLLCETLRSS